MRELFKELSVVFMFCTIAKTNGWQATNGFGKINESTEISTPVLKKYAEIINVYIKKKFVH